MSENFHIVGDTIVVGDGKGNIRLFKNDDDQKDAVDAYIDECISNMNEPRQ